MPVLWSLLLGCFAPTLLQAGRATTRHISRGMGRDDPVCRMGGSGGRGSTSAASASSCLKYIGLDEYSGPDTNGWSNLAFVSPVTVTQTVTSWHGRALLPLDVIYGNARNGKDTLIDLHGTTISACLVGLEGAHSGIGQQRADCVERFTQALLGNATHGGLWQQDLSSLAAKKLVLGTFVGDELLTLGLTASNLTSIIKLLKNTWPTGITYTNFAWGPVMDSDWRDTSGQAFGTPGEQWHDLDWLSYSFYRLTNQSWLQPRCEHEKTLYPAMAPHQKVILQAGAWGSSSGPRYGWPQFARNCSDATVQRDGGRWDICSADPFSCANVTGDAGTAQAGLKYEVDVLLSKIGGRTCWAPNDYDTFNAEQALAIADWAHSDDRVVGIVVWPWATFLQMPYFAGTNVGLQSFSNATATWESIGKAIVSSPPGSPAACGLPPPLSPPVPPPLVPRQVVNNGLGIMTNWDANASAQTGWTSFVFGRGDYDIDNPCGDVDFRYDHAMRCHFDTLQNMAIRKDKYNISSMWGPVCPGPACEGLRVNLTARSGILSDEGARAMDDVLLSLQPYVQNGTISGVFLEDEMTCERGYDPKQGPKSQNCECTVQLCTQYVPRRLLFT
jgi:hypothetical protein